MLPAIKSRARISNIERAGQTFLYLLWRILFKILLATPSLITRVAALWYLAIPFTGKGKLLTLQWGFRHLADTTSTLSKIGLSRWKSLTVFQCSFSFLNRCFNPHEGQTQYLGIRGLITLIRSSLLSLDTWSSLLFRRKLNRTYLKEQNLYIC